MQYMNDLTSWESKEKLLELAKDYEITARQLARWHYEGLIPRPIQHSLGRGRGTQTLYPSGTSQQLLVLCELRKNKRMPLLDVAWKLWWNGYSVKMQVIRTFISNAIGDFNVYKASGKRAKGIVGKRIRNKALNRMLKRVSDEPNLRNVFVETLEGQFNPKGKNLDETIWDITSALKMQPDKISTQSNQPLGPEFLFRLSDAFATKSLHSVLANSSDEDLIQARNDLRLLLSIYEAFNLLSSRKIPEEHYWLNQSGALLSTMVPSEQAMMLMFFRALMASGEAETVKKSVELVKEGIQSLLAASLKE